MRRSLAALVLALVACSSAKSRPAEENGSGVPGAGAGGPTSSDGGTTEGGGASCGEALFVPDLAKPARVFFVSPTGNDSNDGGSAQSAWRSLANVARLGPGDRVDVAAGSYPCGGSITAKGTALAPVVIRSVDGPRKAVFDCSGAAVGLSVTGASYVVVDGLAMSGAQNDLVRVTGSSNVRLTGLLLTGPGDGGVRVLASSSVEVSLSEISGTEAFGPSVAGQGIDLVGVHKAIVVGNVVHGVPTSAAVRVRAGSSDVHVAANTVFDAASALYLGGFSDRADFDPADADVEASAVIAHSNVVFGAVANPFTFLGCRGCLLAHSSVAVTSAEQLVRSLVGSTGKNAATLVSRSSDLRVIDNLFYTSQKAPGQLLAVASEDRTGFVESHNLFFVSGGSAASTRSEPTVGGAGTILDRDPRLTDTASGDLRLLTDSPARGTGLALGEAPYDATGKCRLGAINIGAY